MLFSVSYELHRAIVVLWKRATRAFRSLLGALDNATMTARSPRVVSLVALRIFAAIGSLLFVAAIVRLFPTDDAGQFFYFLAMSQFAAGALLGPLQILSIRYGSNYLEQGDDESLGLLTLFAVGAVGLCSVLTYTLYPQVARLMAAPPMQDALVFTCAVCLGGTALMLNGLSRANGHVFWSLAPESLIKPLGITLVALTLWGIGEVYFSALTAGYLMVMLTVCVALAATCPWRNMSVEKSKLGAFRPYLRAYPWLSLNQLIAAALTTVDLMIVANFVSAEAVPGYKIAVQVAMLAGTGVLFSNVIYGPQIAIAHRNHDRVALQRSARAASRLSFTFFVGTFVPLLASPWAFEAIFGPIGSDAWVLALVLCTGRFANAYFGSVTNVANLSGSTMLIVIMQGVGLLLLMSLGPLLAERYGALGVAWVAGAAATTWTLGTVFFLGLKLKLKMGAFA